VIVSTFGVLIVLSAVVALLASRKWGTSKKRRDAIFSAVSFLGLFVAAAVTWLRVSANR
jgi:hypothetical protein